MSGRAARHSSDCGVAHSYDRKADSDDGRQRVDTGLTGWIRASATAKWCYRKLRTGNDQTCAAIGATDVLWTARAQ